MTYSSQSTGFGLETIRLIFAFFRVQVFIVGLAFLTLSIIKRLKLRVVFNIFFVLVRWGDFFIGKVRGKFYIAYVSYVHKLLEC